MAAAQGRASTRGDPDWPAVASVSDPQAAPGLRESGAAGSRTANQFSSDRIAWAVIAASRYVLGDKPCLTQALAAQLLLKRQGYPASLRIGVSRTAEKQLQAHAWVESKDRVVVGAGELSRYTPLPALDGEQQ